MRARYAHWWLPSALCLLAGLVCLSKAGPVSSPTCGTPVQVSMATVLARAHDDLVVVDSAQALHYLKLDKWAEAAKPLGPGDNVCFTTFDPAAPPAAGNTVAGDSDDIQGQPSKRISLLLIPYIDIGAWRAAGAMFLAFGCVWLLMLLITRGHPWMFILGLDGRLSNSQTQVYFWFLVIAGIYLAETCIRQVFAQHLGGTVLPGTLAALAGISGGTFGTARLTTTLKTGSTKPNAASKPRQRGKLSRLQLLHTLFTNDEGLADLADMQIIVFTVLAGTLYLGEAWLFLAQVPLSGRVDLPPVDDSLLGGTALSCGGYLFKKIASRPGAG